MWPLINNKGGDWFPAKYVQPSSNIKGIYAYKVFVGLQAWVSSWGMDCTTS